MLPALQQSPLEDLPWPDTMPPVLDTPENNDFWSTVALVFIDISSICTMYLPFYNVFRGKGGMYWYHWVIFGLVGAGALWTIWPWIFRIRASENPNDASTYRAWRVNWLIGTIVSIFNLSVVGFYIVVFIFAAFDIGESETIFGLPIGGLNFLLILRETWYIMMVMVFAIGFAISGGLLVYHNKNFWYNFDPEGSRLNVDFEYWGEDRDPNEEDELEEMSEDGDDEDW